MIRSVVLLFRWGSGNGLQEFLRTVVLWRARARSRQELLALPEEMLRDIGRTRAEAIYEGHKPFWLD